MNVLKLFYVAFVWFVNGLNLTSLPKLYYRLSNKRSISVKNLRLLEKNAIKYARRQLDVHYLEYCFDLGLCPETFKFKIPDMPAYKRIKEFYDVALRKQTDEAKYEESKAEKNFLKIKFEIFPNLTLFEKTLLMKLLVAEVARVSEKVIVKHSRKLQLLWRKQRPRSPDCLLNLSSRILTIEEEEALRYGLEHHILPSKVNTDDLKVNLEKATWIASKQLEDGEPVPHEFRQKIIHAVHSFINTARNVCGSKLNRRKHLILKRLASDNTIKICKFDKGTGVCILNHSDYIKKLESIVNDTSKFQKVQLDETKPKDHPVVKKHEKVKRYIKKYLTNEHFDESTISKMNPGSAPGKLYGLVKVHKENNPLRPVCSMVGTPEHCLAKFLDKIIKPHIPNQKMLNSTKNFLDRLDAFDIKPGDKMVSFDVVSLFTNVPLIYTINLISDYIYSSDSPPPFSKTVFKNMMKTATQGYFLFDNILYQQIDGVIMGSPLGPTLANFFMADKERKEWLNDGCNNNPALYLRYVDDIFAIFRQGIDINVFLEKINNSHPNIRFTVEEASETLPFLDVEIKLNESSYDSWVWRKKTHTGVLLNFSALAPLKWKSGLVLCLLHRCWDICSNMNYFQLEVDKLKTMFIGNGYSSKFFDSAFETFWKSKNTEKMNSSENNDINVKIPFIGPASIKFGKSLSSIFKETFGLRLVPVFESHKVKSHFNLKCRTPLPLCSNVVYKFQCLCDTNNSYIGVTSRPFCIRVDEHLNLTKRSSSEADSAINKHLDSCQKCFEGTRTNQFQQFQILRHCTSPYTAKIQEALMIKRHNPKLNIQQFNKGASFTLKIYY